VHGQKSEIEAINAAIIAGKSDDEIRQLVRELEAARTAAGNEETIKGASNDEIRAPAKGLHAARTSQGTSDVAVVRGGASE
jgi:hypothetical protein